MSKPKFIVGIGGSAGGLKAYSALFEALPPNTGMAFVVVAHMSPDSDSLLAAALSRHTSMVVEEARDAMAVLPDHVYVISPNTNLFIEDHTFTVVTPRTMVQGRHDQVDQFLTSLAKVMGPRAISIIVSGGDGDGTAGCKAIKAKGGITFAQDLSAQVDSMPRHAMASGCVDFMLPPGKISEQLIRIAAGYEAKTAPACSVL